MVSPAASMSTDPNPLKQLENKFRSGQISKQDYIRLMYRLHERLFDYSSFIAGRNVDRITITPEHVLVTTKEKVTMICSPDDWRITPVEILNFGDYEMTETRLLLSFLTPESVVVDVGANTGWYCITLGRATPQGKVLAFEPIPQTVSWLRKNLALNAIANVQIFEHGLSDENKELVFYFHTRLSGATSARDLLEGDDKIEVRAMVKRMDDVLAGEPRIDLIKCDVEGAEIFALRGGFETIRRTKPVLFVEMLRKWTAKYDYHPNEIIALMSGADYRCYSVEGGTLRHLEAMDENTAATNFFFLNADRHAEHIARFGHAAQT